MNADQVIQKWRDAVDTAELEAFGALYALDAVLHTPLAQLEGQQAVKEFEGALFSAFSEVSLKTSSVVVSGDTAAVEWEYGGKHTGPLAGPAGTIPPTGRIFSLRGASFMRIDPEGLITEERRYFDARSLFEQLGQG